jgi:hypothetical protein
VKRDEEELNIKQEIDYLEKKIQVHRLKPYPDT